MSNLLLGSGKPMTIVGLGSFPDDTFFEENIFNSAKLNAQTLAKHGKIL